MRVLHHLGQSFMMLALLAPIATAAERPTFNKNTGDPRPDILPYWLHDWHQDYRSLYNRPRYWPGKIAHVIEPTSQEAMVWCEANQMGLYNGKNCPPVYKQYNYARPWEILQTGPRPDFQKPDQLGMVAAPQSGSPTNSVPAPVRSSSDQPVTPPSQDSSAPQDSSALPKIDEATQAPVENASGKASSLIRPARAFHFK